MAQRSPYASRTFAIAIMALATLALSSPSASFAKDFEVWLVDQSNSNGKTFGGTIHIYDGDDLNGKAAASATPADVLDLSGATAAVCLASTGANPVRPHMLMEWTPLLATASLCQSRE